MDKGGLCMFGVGFYPEIPQSNFRRLPFDHCSLSLQPFEYPVCTPEGIVFDLLSIVPWLKKYGTNPITGEVGVLGLRTVR
ncbi:UNVERIFIED_CONTAM: RING-type E3 ubiquitin-protein ligase ppil2 [Gekko kuhli]